MRVNLNVYRPVLEQAILDSSEALRNANPDQEICSLVLYVFSYGADVSICWDTPENSDLMVATWQGHGPGWYAEDEFGRFNGSPADAAFPEHALVSLEAFPDLYAVGDELEFVGPGDEVRDTRRATLGDAGIDEALLPFLRTVLADAPVCSLFRTAKVFRRGIVFHDAEGVFWRSDAPKR